MDVNNVKLLTDIPFIWGDKIKSDVRFYELDYSLNHLKTFKPKTTENSSNLDSILSLNLSINDIKELKECDFSSLTNLRSLDCSLNRISSTLGTVNSNNIRVLNLSNNILTSLNGLEELKNVADLNVSFNEVSSISNFKSLNNLIKLNISNNQLNSLNGTQAFLNIVELNAQNNNITDIFTLSTNRKLEQLYLANNNVKSLSDAIYVLSDLQKLKHLEFKENPIHSLAEYENTFCAALNLSTLDGEEIKPLFTLKRNAENPSREKEITSNLKFKKFRNKKEVEILQLQRRINEIQKEINDYEKTLERELITCKAQTSPSSKPESSQAVDAEQIRDQVSQSFYEKGTTSWTLVGSSKFSTPNFRLNKQYQDVKDTDEVLRCAYNELLKNS